MDNLNSEFTTEQVDQMYNDAMSPAPSEQQSLEQQAPQTEEQLFDIKWGGETKSLPKDKVINYAQQGYDYATKMQQYNLDKKTFDQERQSWEQERNDLKAKYDYLDQINSYAEQNPQWLNLVQTEYQKAMSGQATQEGQEGNPNLLNNPYIQQMQQTIKDMKSQLDEQMKHQKMKQQAEEDAALDNAILDYKTKNEGFDWSAKDDQGMNLEQQILKHAQDQGINNFRAAANDYLHDQLLAKAKESGKEGLADSIKRDTKLGLVSQSKQSKLLTKPAQNIMDKSYEALAMEAMNELNI